MVFQIIGFDSTPGSRRLSRSKGGGIAAERVASAATLLGPTQRAFARFFGTEGHSSQGATSDLLCEGQDNLYSRSCRRRGVLPFERMWRGFVGMTIPATSGCTETVQLSDATCAVRQRRSSGKGHMTLPYNRDHAAGQFGRTGWEGRRRGSALMVLALLVLAYCPCAQAAPKQSNGFWTKIAFVFNLLKFAEWPEQDSTGKFVVGVIGKTPLAPGTSDVPAKVGDRSVSITVIPTWSKSGNEIQDTLMAECHVLFVCESAQAHTPQILEQIRGKAILTVGETDEFLKQGGIISLFVEDRKVQFDANLNAAKASNIIIRAKLLRLARNVTQ